MKVEEYLKDNQIKYILHEHPAVFTVKEAQKFRGNIPGLACKNLLLRSKPCNRYVLLILSADKRADLKKLSRTMGEEKVIFASADNLKEKLGLEPGSVSPFGLINDKNHDVEVYIEPEVFNADIVSFHPNINTATLELTGEMFIKFLQGTGNKIQVV